MKHDTNTTRTTPRSALFLACILLVFAPSVRARGQQQQGAGSATIPTQRNLTNKATDTSAERAEEVLQRALQAVGGSAFLGVRSVISRGLYTQFKDGVSGSPSTFVDYLVFPDRERTEFKGHGVRSIQTYTGATGWLFDGMTRNIKDVKPDDVKEFQLALRTSLDNVLRGWWRKEGAKLSYVGRREAGLAKRNDVVRLIYPDGFTVEFEFGTRDSLPYRTVYKRQRGDGEEVEEEDRHARHLAFEGVRIPTIIDHFRAGMQTSRIAYETIEFNRPIPDALFARPADVKALK
ncbi:MAG TPA: hypothetical protein VGB73_18415 [Pyrinomonadaceae bacterium]|jgi:hypothetical protein